MGTERAVLLVGAGGHARVCIDVIERQGQFKIVGLVGLPKEVGQTILSYPIIGADEDLGSLAGRIGCALVTLGQIKTPEPRMRLFERLLGEGYSLPSVLSPLAYVSPHAKVGEGTIVMHGAIINAGATIGRNCIINSQALVEHNVSVGDHCHISTGVRVNGGVSIGQGCFIGSGTVIREGLSIGDRCLIGMGQLVWKNCDQLTRIPWMGERT